MGWTRLTVWNARRACLGRTIRDLELALGRCTDPTVADPAGCQARLLRSLEGAQSARHALAVAAGDPWVCYLRAHLKGTSG